MHKICFILFFAVLVVAAEAVLAAEGLDDSFIMMEKCDPEMCGSDLKNCHRCCNRNYHINYQAAGNNEELQHEAIDAMCEEELQHETIDAMCECYHNVNNHKHHEDIPAL